MAFSFAWMFGEAKLSGKKILMGLRNPELRSKTINQAVGIVGCAIMPPNVFLDSSLIQLRVLAKGFHDIEGADVIGRDNAGNYI